MVISNPIVVVDTNKAFDGLSKGLLAAAGGIKVNGNKLGAFIAFLVIHSKCHTL